VASAALPANEVRPLTLGEYTQALDDSLAIAHQLNDEPQHADELLNSLPAAWHVEADGRNFAISTENLRRNLAAWRKNSDHTSLDHVVQCLETLRDEAAAYATSEGNSSSSHALLNAILARREFRHVRGETWLDRFKQRIYRFLIKLLGRVFFSSAVSVISNILVYGLIALAVPALVYWLYRSMREGSRLETIMPSGMPVSAKEWPVWMSEARAAAARGNWRDAVHLAYWSGISFLEAGGAWRPDVARTPREYLRLLPAASSQQPALRALTVQLETVWYGMQTADADAFQQTLAELEKLGFPCN
jgi:hypothetical protein